MSYSFHVKAPNKEAAKIAVLEKFDEIVEQQPVHKRDRKAILVNAGAVIDLLADDDTKDVSVSCNGYVSWYAGDSAPGATGHLETAPLHTVSVACSASHADRSGNPVSADRA